MSGDGTAGGRADARAARPPLTEAEYAAWADARMREMVGQFTELLPQELRDAGVRFGWTHLPPDAPPATVPPAVTEAALLEAAWRVIANAGWDGAAKSPGWQEAAARWRDDYHRWLAVQLAGLRAVVREQAGEAFGVPSELRQAWDEIREAGTGAVSMAPGSADPRFPPLSDDMLAIYRQPVADNGPICADPWLTPDPEDPQ